MNRHFVEILRALSDAGAEHLVIGAHAVAAHGHLRATEDRHLHPARLGQCRACHQRHQSLRCASARLDGCGSGDSRYRIGVRPFRIDLINDISGVTFEEAWHSRLEIEIDELMIPFIGKDALIKNKRATGRPQDLLDAEALERA